MPFGTNKAGVAKATDEVGIRDCQTQTYNQADLELAEENEKNHQKEPEATVSGQKTESEIRAFEEDKLLMGDSNAGLDQQKGEMPWNGNKQSTGTGPSGKSPGANPGAGDPGKDAAKDPAKGPAKDPNASAKKIAKYAIGFTAGAVAIGTGAFIAAPFILTGMGFTTSGIAAGSLGASMMSASAIANGGGVAAGSVVALLQSAGAAGGIAAGTCATIGVGSAAVITGLVGAGEVVVSAVRYKKKPTNKLPTSNEETQTD